MDHDCFKHYNEEVDHISIDENHVVTILQTNPTVVNRRENLDELFIEVVRSKRALYDFRVPASKRTMLHKNALWMEVSNILQGSLSPEEAKARWKYLRDNYIKARKKIQTYVPSGSAATGNITAKKTRFQYYELMKLLNDSLQTRPTVSSLTDTSEIVTSFNIGDEQNKNDIARPLTTLQTISAINNSPERSASVYIPSRTPSPTNISPQAHFIDVLSPSTTDFSVESEISTRTRDLKRSAQNFINDHQPSVLKKKKNNALEAALIEALKEPATQPIDPLDAFLVRLGEGMRKLSYRDRAQLEIQFVTLLAEKENFCFDRDQINRSDRST